MSEDRAAVDVELALAAAGSALGRTLALVEDLRGSPRSDVWRAGDDRGSVVVKAHRDTAGSWRREPLGLQAAEPSGVGPRLLAVAEASGVVVMEDLGSGPSVADALLGDDSIAAEASMHRWAESVAALHAATLGQPAPDGVEPYETAGVVAESADELTGVCADLGLDGSPASLLPELARTLSVPEATAVSPGDVCPDNNIELDGRVRLFDFEFADLRHVAWDAAYLRVPWPTCWCSWQVPDDVSARVLERYRTRLAPALPYVADDAFDRDLDTAVLVWCLTTCAWFLPHALGADPAPTHPATPSRAALILHRLALTTTLPGPEELHELARGLRTMLVDRWGEHDLPPAPAFR